MSEHCDDFELLPDPAAAAYAPARDEHASATPAARTTRTNSGRAARPIDLARFAECLARLGAVLWLDRNDRHRSTSLATIGADGVLLLDHPALGTLAHCAAATAHTQVTAQGPREWLGFRDAEGSLQAKLFLLPDTDYLAWDEMIEICDLAPAALAPLIGWHAHTAFLRHALSRIGTPWHARLLTFEHRALPWLRMLGAKPPLRISLLGLELARTIARCEGAELVSPLHS